MKTDVPSCTQQDTNALHLIQPFPKCYRHLRELDVAKPGGCTQLGKCSCSMRPGQGLVTSAAASSLYHNVPHPSPAHSPWDLLWKWRLPLSGCHVPWHGPVWRGTARHSTARSPRCLCCGVARCSTVPQPGHSADRSSTSTTSSLLAASTPTSPSPCPHQSGRQHWDGSGHAGAAITLLLPVTSPLQKARRAGRRPRAPSQRPRKFPLSEGINR